MPNSNTAAWGVDDWSRSLAAMGWRPRCPKCLGSAVAFADTGMEQGVRAHCGGCGHSSEGADHGESAAQIALDWHR